MQLNRAPLFEGLGLHFDRVAHCSGYFRKNANLMNAVLAVLRGSKIEPKVDLLRTIRDLQYNLTAVFFRIAADVFLTRVFDDRDDIRSHLGECVEELASLNMIFLAHFRFLKIRY